MQQIGYLIYKKTWPWSYGVFYNQRLNPENNIEKATRFTWSIIKTNFVVNVDILWWDWTSASISIFTLCNASLYSLTVTSFFPLLCESCMQITQTVGYNLRQTFPPWRVMYCSNWSEIRIETYVKQCNFNLDGRLCHVSTTRLVKTTKNKQWYTAIGLSVLFAHIYSIYLPC